MAWKVSFDEGVDCFKRGRFCEALGHMNQVTYDIHDIAMIP